MSHKHIRPLLLVLLLCVGQRLHAQLTVHNNLLYDATLTPNAGLEFRLDSTWTMGANVGFRPWPGNDEKVRKWRHVMPALYVRHWNDSVWARGFWGMTAVYSHYNVSDVTFPFGLYRSVRDERRQGDLVALGVSYGHSWRLNRWFRLEAEAGLDVGYAWGDKYACGHCGTKLGDFSGPFLMPKLGLNIVLHRVPKPVATIVTMEEQPTPPVSSAVEQVFEPQFHPVPDNTGAAGLLEKDNPVLAHISEYRPYDRTRVLRKEKGALYVHFELGKAVLDHSFRDNAPTLDRIVDITRQVMADTTSAVKRIQIVGLASIEGSIANNERLAGARADALKQYLQARVATPDSLYDMANGGEAWAELRDQLNDALMANGADSPIGTQLAEALSIIDTEQDLNRREQRLQRLNGGRTWQYLKEHLMADLRNSGYLRIYYDYVPDTAAATINQASELLAEERYDEALALLQTVGTDERAQNALGVALHMTGHTSEALRCFNRAASQGNADARENLRQLSELQHSQQDTPLTE